MTKTRLLLKIIGYIFLWIYILGQSFLWSFAWGPVAIIIGFLFFPLLTLYSFFILLISGKIIEFLLCIFWVFFSFLLIYQADKK
jgi:hypothetical protein